MTQELTQRLVGAVVITALAAIFLPMLFDDPLPETKAPLDTLAIPEPPQVSTPNTPPLITTAPQILPSTPQTLVQEPLDPSLDTDPMLEDAPLNSMPPEAPIASLTPQQLINQTQQAISSAPVPPKLEDFEALKDKKERLKILNANLAATESITEKSAARTINDRKLNDMLDVHKPKEHREFNKPQAHHAQPVEKDLPTNKQSLEKLARDKADYQKLIDKKNQERAVTDKKNAEKLALNAKLEAKQQALDDSAAVEKIAADKLNAAKATGTRPATSRWYVRIGSFSQESNALALRDKLRAQGYNPVMDVINSAAKGKLYRLRIGPEVNKPSAEKIRQKVDTSNHSKSILELE